MPERRRKRTNQDRGTDEVKQDRSLLLYVLLSFVTFSVYHFYFMDLWAKDVNILCEKDGKHTVGVEKMMLFSVLTFGVYKYVWLGMENIGSSKQFVGVSVFISCRWKGSKDLFE